MTGQTKKKQLKTHKTNKLIINLKYSLTNAVKHINTNYTIFTAQLILSCSIEIAKIYATLTKVWYLNFYFGQLLFSYRLAELNNKFFLK